MSGSARVSHQSGIYTFPEFSKRALAVFSSREYDANKDLGFFLKALGLRLDRFATVHQIHGDRVVTVSEKTRGDCGDADALVTDQKNLALVIRTADCVPLFFLDPVTPAVGVTHAGWRGVKQGIISRTVETFRERFKTEPKTLRVAIGPAIRESCYEVGPEFEEYFPGFVKPEAGKRLLDLVGKVKAELQDLGIPAGSISDSELCTACDLKHFFSARKEGQKTGRLISLIMLK